MRWQFSTFAFIWHTWRWWYKQFSLTRFFWRFLDLSGHQVFDARREKVPQTTWFTQHDITIENKAEQEGPDRSGQFRDFLGSSGWMSERRQNCEWHCVVDKGCSDAAFTVSFFLTCHWIKTEICTRHTCSKAAVAHSKSLHWVMCEPRPGGGSNLSLP